MSDHDHEHTDHDHEADGAEEETEPKAGHPNHATDQEKEECEFC